MLDDTMFLTTSVADAFSFSARKNASDKVLKMKGRVSSNLQ